MHPWLCHLNVKVLPKPWQLGDGTGGQRSEAFCFPSVSDPDACCSLFRVCMVTWYLQTIKPMCLHAEGLALSLETTGSSSSTGWSSQSLPTPTMTGSYGSINSQVLETGSEVQIKALLLLLKFLHFPFFHEVNTLLPAELPGSTDFSCHSTAGLHEGDWYEDFLILCCGPSVFGTIYVWNHLFWTIYVWDHLCLGLSMIRTIWTDLTHTVDFSINTASPT